MPETPLVTIVTPSYNQAQFLEETLRSVLDQDYPSIEYLVVDGASKDGSVEVIRRYADRLAWWVSEPDHGQAEAINKGFARASGKYVAWLNSDDVYLPGAISAAVRELEAHPELGMVFADVLSIDEHGTPINLMRFADWGLDELMSFHIICQPAVFMRRETLLQAGFLDNSFDLLLDHHLWLRMAQLAPMRYVRATWAKARFHAAAKNISRAPQYGIDAYALVEWMQAQPGLIERFARNRNKIWAGAHRFNAWYLLEGGQPRAALAAYMKSLRAYPPTALAETHRILFALLSLAGMDWLKPVYLGLRRAIRPPRP